MRIEPLISLQWFCDMEKLAGPAIAAAKDGRLRFHPEPPYTRVYLDWLENIRPWCISRQLWWGHQIPVWYRGEETYAGEEPPEGDGWERDPDVLDTWFSSALWPFATLGWPEQTDRAARLLPHRRALHGARHHLPLGRADGHVRGGVHRRAAVRPTCRSTPRSWRPTAGACPSRWAPGIDPLDEIGEHGADALRFGLLAMASTQDVRYSAERVRQGRDLANKLWNASRLILLGVQEGAEPSPDVAETVEDRWILSRLERVTERTRELIEAFELSAATLELYDFFWSELCDWYLELAKPRLYDEAGDRRAVSATLLFALDRVLRAAAPGDAARDRGDLVVHAGRARAAGRGRLARARARRASTRRPRPRWGARSRRSPSCAATASRRGSSRRPCCPRGWTPTATRAPRRRWPGWRGSTSREGTATPPPPRCRCPAGRSQLLPDDAFDPGEAERRIAARRDQLGEEIARLEKKLANERFVERAPADVVEGEREKLDDYRQALASLED